VPASCAPRGRILTYPLYALGLLTTINVLSFVNRNVIFALFETIERELGLRDADAGWLAAAYVLMFSLAALPLGVLSDLRSRRAVLAWGVAGWSAFTILGALVQGFWQLFFCRAAVGVGGAAAAAAAAALVADFFPGPRRALAMGIYMSGIALGGVLGIVVGGELQAVYGWRLAFVAVGLPGLLIALLAARLVDPTKSRPLLTVRQYLRELELGAFALVRACFPVMLATGVGAIVAFFLDRQYGSASDRDVAAFALIAGLGLALNIWYWVRQSRHQPGLLGTAVVESAVEEMVRGSRAVLRTPTLVYVFLGGALISFGMNGLVGWAPTFMSRELGLSVAMATRTLGRWGLLMGIAGTVVGGSLADWLRRYTPTARVLTVATGFLIGGPLALWLLTIRDFDLFQPVFCAAFFFLSWYSGPIAAVIFDVVPARIGASVVGAYLFFIHLAGDSIAFPLVGALSDRFGIDRAVFLLPIAGLLGGLVVLFGARTVAGDMERAISTTAEWEARVLSGG